jgi:hypothetical protein
MHPSDKLMHPSDKIDDIKLDFDEPYTFGVLEMIEATISICSVAYLQ